MDMGRRGLASHRNGIHAIYMSLKTAVKHTILPLLITEVQRALTHRIYGACTYKGCGGELGKSPILCNIATSSKYIHILYFVFQAANKHITTDPIAN